MQASGANNSLLFALFNGATMRLFELFEAKTDKKPSSPAPRNFVAKNMIQTGAGPMKDKSKVIPRKEKHKGKVDHS